MLRSFRIFTARVIIGHVVQCGATREVDKIGSFPCGEDSWYQAAKWLARVAMEPVATTPEFTGPASARKEPCEDDKPLLRDNCRDNSEVKRKRQRVTQQPQCLGCVLLARGVCIRI